MLIHGFSLVNNAVHGFRHSFLCNNIYFVLKESNYMFICEILLFDFLLLLFFYPQFGKSDMSKYGYHEVFQRGPSTSR